MSSKEEEVEPKRQPLVMMLNEVAFKRKMTGAVGAGWVESVRAKLEGVGVETLRDFVQQVLEINPRLMTGWLQCLHDSTLNMMLAQICEMVMGPEEE